MKHIAPFLLFAAVALAQVPPFPESILPPQTYNATVSWEGPTNAASYCVYYGIASRNYTNRVPCEGRSCGISNLVDGVTYYFGVTAFSVTGNESEYSEEASFNNWTDGPPPLTNTIVTITSSVSFTNPPGSQAFFVLCESTNLRAGQWQPVVGAVSSITSSNF